MSDITRMNGRFDPPVTEGNNSVLMGSVPVATMRDYAREVASYTKGHGRLSCSLQGYEPCHNTEEVMTQTDYDPEADTANPTGSVFCAHGAGFQVPWDQVSNMPMWRAAGYRIRRKMQSRGMTPYRECRQ